MKRRTCFSVLVVFLFFWNVVCADSRSVMQEAKALFATFELNEQPLSAEQLAATKQMVEQLLTNMPTYPSGQYLALLGDANYYVGNFGEALLFWRSAQLRLPFSEGLQKRIMLVRHVLKMELPLIERPVSDFLGLSFLSKGMKYVLLLMVWAMAFIFWSLWQIFYFRPLHHLFFCIVSLAVLLTASVAWYEWVVPPRVVVLQETELRGSAAPKMQGERIQYQLSTGEEAEVVSSSPDKKWLRIRTGNGHSGYVSGAAVGFIE